MSLKAFGIIDEILDIGHCEEPDWKARKKSSQHQDKPVGLPFQDNSPESIMSQLFFACTIKPIAKNHFCKGILVF